MKKNVLLLLLTIFFISCNKNELEQSLLFAGDHRDELEKVLSHYKQHVSDSLKYKAACFLIENMRYKYSLTVDSNDVYTMKPDIREIKASLLISHIDHVFSVKKYPWFRPVSFPEFCEYLLPYRRANEPLEEWMPLYLNYLKTTIDSLTVKKPADLTACNYLLSTLYPSPLFPLFTKTDPLPSSLLGLQNGNCRQYVMLGCFTLQALGMPVAWDFTPQWANRSMGHEWNVALLTENRQVPFLFGDKNRFGEHFTNPKKQFDKLAKVYRKTFEIQNKSLAMHKLKEDIPPFFKDPYFKDVSPFYFKPYDANIELTIAPPSKKEIAYIMVFDNKEWQPIHWSFIKKNKALFTKMATGCIYLAMYYHNNHFYPASEPFYLNEQGEICYIKANPQETVNLCLSRKYPDFRMLTFVQDMIGGCFQGSDDKDFGNFEILYQIDKIPDVNWQTVKVNNTNKYRYVRYWGGLDSWGNMAELEFYTVNNGSPEKLSGEIIGTGRNFITEGKTKERAFDGDPLTFFEELDLNGAWVGLDLGKPRSIDSIRFLPRNDDNNIRIGDEYELMYWDNKQWNSLGKQVAKEYVLVYNQIPGDALYLLHNRTRGIEERIFTYENGKQIWW
jgi:hypothetical protein